MDVFGDKQESRAKFSLRLQSLVRQLFLNRRILWQATLLNQLPNRALGVHRVLCKFDFKRHHARRAPVMRPW